MKRILLAGATGYLGRHIVWELMARQMNFKAMGRTTEKLDRLGVEPAQRITCQITDKASLEGCCHGIDTVISTVGITRQKDGLTYMEVDYQANKNLLDEAVKSGVRKFIYVSVLHGEKLKHLKICEAKEKFVEALEKSGLEYCIVRPSGFFSDMKAFYEMAKKGRVYLFGNGQTKVNPIHGADLAEACVDMIFQHKKNLQIGGKETLTHQEIAQMAFEVVGQKTKITYIPDWVRKSLLRLAYLFLGNAQYGTTEFFLHVMAIDMSTNPHGTHTLKAFFQELNNRS